jgi:hypothetical protein
VGWRVNEGVIRSKPFQKCPNQFLRDNALADSFYIDACVSRRRGAIQAMVNLFLRRMPGGQGLKFFALRNGALVEYPTRRFLRHLQTL